MEWKIIQLVSSNRFIGFPSNRTLLLKPSNTVKSQYTVFICAEFYGFSKLFSDYSQIVFTDNLNFFVIFRIHGFYQSSRVFGSIRFRYPCSI